MSTKLQNDKKSTYYILVPTLFEKVVTNDENGIHHIKYSHSLIATLKKKKDKKQKLPYQDTIVTREIFCLHKLRELKNVQNSWNITMLTVKQLTSSSLDLKFFFLVLSLQHNYANTYMESPLVYRTHQPQIYIIYYIYICTLLYVITDRVKQQTPIKMYKSVKKK